MISYNDFAYPRLMHFFEEISAIPRASYKEEKIADYLCEFARERGLEYYRDATNNVLINLPASKGCEAREAILLQGHTDMVCEKNEGVAHDFDNDGLELYEEDGWIRARGTTLGADDGVAVAAMLYVLDGALERHGAIQCLFTASEEVGLDGAQAFDYSRIFARKMINMDSPDDAQIIVGCAGGQRSSMTLAVSREKISAAYVARICVTGLFGGHSGEDIDKGRANANKLMGRVLYRILGDSVRLVNVNGGSSDNAIPRECTATVCGEDIEALRCRIAELDAQLKVEMSPDDCAFAIGIEEMATNTDVDVIDRNSERSVVFVMHTVPDGIFEMNQRLDGIVEWSRNLGIVSTTDTEISLVFMARSSLESRIDEAAAELDDFAGMIGASMHHYNRYPGWSFAPVSAVRDAYVAAYEQTAGRKPEIITIHAGLECGFISEALPDMDIISCGPLVQSLHSPDERLNKISFERFFAVLKGFLEQGL